MIKLILSDIDGTLIPYGQTELNPRLFPLIRRLRRRGVLFCPASGRQYHSLRTLFAPVADQLVYLCENGAILYGPGPEEEAPVLAKTPMPRPDALALARAILALPGCQVLISGANMSYVHRRCPAFARRMETFTGNRVALFQDLEEIGEDILKVSAFQPDDLAPAIGALGPRWGEAYHMAVAGPEWLDFMLADKGVGLEGLCRALQIAPREVAAFGDNYNDAPMLQRAGQAWLMEGAAAQLRSRFPRSCASVEDKLEQLLAQ